MPNPNYLPLIDQLAGLEPAVYVFGGFAEDAVLNASITRPHGDIDVLVARAALGRHLEQLRGLGYADFEILFESSPGVPLVLGATNRGLSLELGVFDELEPGRPSFVLPVEGGAVRITLPADTFTFPVSSIDGVPIRTISPLALYQLRQALIETGAFGPPRDKDLVAQARLRAALLGNAPTANLRPPIEPVAWGHAG